MNDDRYHELVLHKLDSVTEELRELRNECHTTFARGSDLSVLRESLAKLEARLESLSTGWNQHAGARSVEVGVAKWTVGIAATVVGAVVTAWLLAQ